jgi:multisubunit Na+/H+ antiporter MnhB subunit
MLTTIIAIITIVIMLAYLFRMLNRVYCTKSWFTEFIVIMLCLLVLTLLNPDTSVNSASISEAYDRGFHDAIVTAELVDVYDSGYTIAFGEGIPEVHHYTYDGSHLVPIKDVSEK